MTTLPTASQLITAATVADMKDLVGDQATAISEMPGGAVATTLTIAVGQVTPTVGCHLVDTEAAAASDDLTNIVTTNHPDGRRLLISMVDAARIVTVKHNAGGAGQIALANSYDLVLKVGGWVELKRTGANWEEVNRSQNLISTIQISGAVNEAYATVASHATTADIWGARGNVINFTGTATVTAFPAAPQAGVRRRLICAGACSFTAGASMVIDGVASASTLTVAAGDVVDVESVSTTSFKLHYTPVGGVLTVTSYPTLVSLEGLSLAAGDILYATAADTLARLPAGTLGDLVQSGGASGNPSFVSTLTGVKTFDDAARGSITALTSSGASIAIDLSASNFFSHTFTENTTLANPTNIAAGQSGVIAFTQHASSPKTLAFGSYWDTPGGSAPSVTATNSAVDLLVYYVINTTKIAYKLLADVK